MISPGDDLLVQLRRRAFGIAYRMLGSVAEAEDIAQEALLRVHQVLDQGEHLESPEAYITTVATRLSIDELRSARARRESYIGEWLPEPLLAGAGEDPAGRAELEDSLSLAFLVLLERLSPSQRAALLLHDVFGYGYDEVAEIVDTSVDNARQLVARARRYVREHRPRFDVPSERRDQLAGRFFAAIQEGDVAGLEALLARDVVLYGDGGGKVPALAGPVRGRARVARTLANWGRQGQRMSGVSVRLVEVNAQPGMMIFDRDGRLVTVMAVDVDDSRIAAVHSIVNPDKLRHLGPVGNLRELLASRES